MKDKTLDQLALFTANAQTMKQEFTWHHALTKRLAALLYAREGRPVDGDAIRECHALIKRNTGVFSAFRGNMALCVAALLSLSPDPQGTLDGTLQAYGLLKRAKLHASDFLVIAAHQIVTQADPANFENVANRTRGFYDGMKAHHFFYTGQDDYIFSAMLALAELDVATGVERIERLYNRLKHEFWSKNSVQSLAQVLVLGDSDAAVDRVLGLRDALRAQRIKLDRAHTLPVLGVLALLPTDMDAIVRDIGEAQAFLRSQKGFGPLSVTTQELLLFAASFIADDCAQDMAGGVLTATLSTSIANIILAQQAALIAAMSASAAASSSSS